jgi:hypothetical protein
MIRVLSGIGVAKYPDNNPVAPLINSAPVYGFRSGLNAAELFP